MRYMINDRDSAYILKKGTSVDEVYNLTILMKEKGLSVLETFIVTDKAFDLSKNKIMEQSKCVLTCNITSEIIEHTIPSKSIYETLEGMTEIISVSLDNGVRSFDLLNYSYGTFDECCQFLLLKFYNKDEVTVKDTLINVEAYLKKIATDIKTKESLVNAIAKMIAYAETKEEIYNRLMSLSEEEFINTILEDYMEGINVVYIYIDIDNFDILPSTPINSQLITTTPNETIIKEAAADFIRQMTYDYNTWLSDVVHNDMDNTTDVLSKSNQNTPFDTFDDMRDVEKDIFKLSQFIQDGTVLNALNKLRMRYSILRYAALNDTVRYYTDIECDFFKFIKSMGAFLDNDDSVVMNDICSKFTADILHSLTDVKLCSLITSDFHIVPSASIEVELAIDQMILSVISGFVNIISDAKGGLYLTTGVKDYSSVFKINRKDDDDSKLNIRTLIKNACELYSGDEELSNNIEKCIIDISFTIPIVDEHMSIIDTKEITAEEMIHVIMWYMPSIVDNIKALQDKDKEEDDNYVSSQLMDRYIKALVNLLITSTR